jgi:hypothetical protein
MMTGINRRMQLKFNVKFGLRIYKGFGKMT